MAYIGLYVTLTLLWPMTLGSDIGRWHSMRQEVQTLYCDCKLICNHCVSFVKVNKQRKTNHLYKKECFDGPSYKRNTTVFHSAEMTENNHVSVLRTLMVERKSTSLNKYRIPL